MELKNLDTVGLGRFLLAAMLLGASGCASILSGSMQELTFESDPPGATVSVGGKEVGKTPVTARVKREDKQALLVEKEGYKPFKTEMVTKTNGLVWLNALFLTTGVCSSTTDANTGAIREYAQDKYSISLVPAGAVPLYVEGDKARKVREFVISGYLNIQAALAKGSGEYLDSLFNLLEVSPDGRKDALEKMRALSTLYKDIPTFADKLNEVFLGNH